ncbi:MAG: hypothetical protein OH318_02235 [Candidatus Parvarchaeota archaeon]|nr:hypothetical protein [Candidatus Rehaiarchaeum fermentans]MCW1293481.1 hypothetical protein [Candidatus Rehaiarchaeum fermentans]
MKVICLGDEEFVIGMRMVGLDGEIMNKEEFVKSYNKFLDYDIVIVDKEIAEGITEDLEAKLISITKPIFILLREKEDVLNLTKKILGIDPNNLWQ